jgi:hypothetical protein
VEKLKVADEQYKAFDSLDKRITKYLKDLNKRFQPEDAVKPDDADDADKPDDADDADKPDDADDADMPDDADDADTPDDADSADNTATTRNAMAAHSVPE